MIDAVHWPTIIAAGAAVLFGLLDRRDARRREARDELKAELGREREDNLTLRGENKVLREDLMAERSKSAVLAERVRGLEGPGRDGAKGGGR